MVFSGILISNNYHFHNISFFPECSFKEVKLTGKKYYSVYNSLIINIVLKLLLKRHLKIAKSAKNLQARYYYKNPKLRPTS